MGNNTETVLSVTDKAAAKIAALAGKEGREDPVLRIRVLAGGCSGFRYELAFDDAPAEGDQVVPAGKVTVVVDRASASIIQGSTLDFDDALLGGGLKMRNPRAVQECACGESFSV